jgi:hypothetical protein
MNSNRQSIKMVLVGITRCCLIIGDILFAVFIIQLITEFEAHPSYPFLGVQGWLVIIATYSLGLLCDIAKRRISD